MNAHTPTTRTRAQVRTDRFTVMSAALTLFRERVSNTARRDKWSADRMRFAGDEARFCIAEAKYNVARDEAASRLQRAVHQSRVDLAERMTPAERAERIKQLRNGIAGLKYSPFGINLQAKRREYEAEIEALEMASQWSKPVDDAGKSLLIAAVASALEQVA